MMGYAMLQEAYNSLSAEKQKNVEQFAFFLVEQQKKEFFSQSSQESKSSQAIDFASKLDSFIGCTHVWDNIDVMNYQKQLRGEYRVD